uniref:RNA-directed DNA polymerase n=1 Tax=Tanacetum cinerariifolium TaxID=118510 RepID=A0A6L2KLY2_TANCI|nr:putative reverse transcriptase domain-containing protein [Tanacetum cinerariifolium]
MDLFGPTFVKSLNKKSYCLVVTDDYSRFSWVFFLATKDETSTILKTFITGIEIQTNHKVKIIRSDNETEFKNHDLNQFCGIKGIKREFSVARTPQQNEVAKRKNRTLIEVARTMLPDSLLPIPFWAKAVKTACYVQNRADEGFLIGYSVTSKAFRVFNSRTKIVQETLQINLLKNQPNGNQPNPSAGIQGNFDADADATFDVKDNKIKVHVSPSSSDKPRKHDEKAKREAKGKSPIDLSIGVRDLSDEFEEFSVNSTNMVNAASAPATVVGLNSTNSTNSFNAAGPSDNAVSLNLEISGKSSFVDPSQYLDDPDMPAFEDIIYLNDEEYVGAEAKFYNLETSITVSPILTTKVYKDHPISQIIGTYSGGRHSSGFGFIQGMSWVDFKALLMEEFCLSNKMENLESEFWNHTMVGANHAWYIDWFHELAKLVPHLVTPKSKCIGSVILKAGILTDEVVRCGTLTKSSEKRKEVKETSKQGGSREDNKKAKVGKGFMATTPPRNVNVGAYLKDCKALVKQVAPVSAVRMENNQRVCYECGSSEHLRNTCPKLNRAPGQAGNHLALEGNRNTQNNRNQAKGRAFCVNAVNALQDPYIMTGTFSLNDHFATVLFDNGDDFNFTSTIFTPLLNLKPSIISHGYVIKVANGKKEKVDRIIRDCKLELGNSLFIIDLIPLGHGSFDVIVGMNWLSKNKAEIVCHEKVVRIPLGGEDLLGLPPQRQVEFRIDLILEATLLAKSQYQLTPSEMQDLSKQLQELQDKGFIRPSHSSWGAPVLFAKKKNGSMRMCIDYRKTKEDHEVHLKLVLELLKKEKLYAKFSKCEFWLEEVHFLGHVVNQNGIHVDPSKIEVVKNWKAPTTPSEIQSFLGLAGYYRRLIANFSKIAKPLTLLTHKNKKYEWGVEQEEAFQTLKDNLCNDPILSLLDRIKDFVVYCDASNQRLCTHTKRQARQLKIHEKNYTTHNLELGAVVFAFKTWRHYLYETKSVIYTDHKSLQHIFDQKELNMRQRRWIELFSDYECEIRYYLAQSEAFKEENALAQRLHGLDQQMKRKEYESLYFMDHIWVSLVGGVRTIIMDEAHKTRSRCTVYILFLENITESFRNMIGYEYDLSSSDGRTKSPILWAEIRESRLIGSKLVQETSDKVVLIKEKLKAARDRQKSYADNRRKPLEFEVGGQVLLKVSPWKIVIRFRKKGKLASRYVRPFKIIERIGPVAYRLRLPEELSCVHDTFHVSNLKKCLVDANLHVPLDEIEIDKTLRFVEELVEIMDREVKSLKCSKIPIVKVCWNSKRGLEFT